MKRILPILFVFGIPLCLFITLSRRTVHNVAAVLASHVVISEIQIAGGTTTDEFTELYNPTGSLVSMTGWQLMRKTAGGTESLVATVSGSIASHGYFLLAHTDYDSSITEDQTYTENIAANNTVLLYSDAGVTIVDKVGMGTAGDFEGTATSSPDADRSIERKALSTSTLADMVAGGAHASLGNGEDSDTNSADFVYRTLAQGADPQNAAAVLEDPGGPTSTPTPTTTPTETLTPTSTPTGTLTPTDTPTGTPTGSPTSTPTSTPTNTPTNTSTPTPTETNTPTPTGTGTPTSTPTNTPTPTGTLTLTPTNTPTSSPTGTVTPTVTSTPTPTPTVTPPFSDSQIIAAFPSGRSSITVCTLQYRLFGSGFLKVWFPTVSCRTIHV